MKNIELGLTEHQIQNQCIQYLRMKGFYVMRLNSGKYSMQDKFGKTRHIIGQEAGTPDVMAFRNYIGKSFGDQRETDLVFLEVKKPNKNPTSIQEAKMAELEEYGARCLVIHSLDELQKYV